MNTVFALYLEALGLNPAYWQIETPTFAPSHRSLHVQWRYPTSNAVSTPRKATTTHMAPSEVPSFLGTAHQQQAYQQLMNAVAYFQTGLAHFPHTDRFSGPLSRSQALTIVTDLLHGSWHQVASHVNFSNTEAAHAGHIESVVLRKGRTVSFLESTLYNDRAQLIAHSQHTFQLS